MSTKIPDDIMLPMGAASTDARPSQSRLLAFVPISIALIGIAAILVGRVTAHDIAAIDKPGAVDPIQTGSIQAAPISGYGIDAVAR